MHFTFTVTVEVERMQGKFATREELAEQIIAELDGVNPGQLEGENGGQYEVSGWEVSEEPQVRKRSALSKAVSDLAAKIAQTNPGAKS